MTNKAIKTFVILSISLSFLTIIPVSAKTFYLEDFEFDDDIRSHGFDIQGLNPGFTNVNTTEDLAISGRRSLLISSFGIPSPTNPLIVSRKLNIDLDNVSDMFVGFSVLSVVAPDLSGVFNVDVTNGTHTLMLEYGRFLNTTNPFRIAANTLYYNTNTTFEVGFWNRINRSIITDIKIAKNHTLFPFNQFNLKTVVNFHIIHDHEMEQIDYWDLIIFSVKFRNIGLNNILLLINQFIVNNPVLVVGLALGIVIIGFLLMKLIIGSSAATATSVSTTTPSKTPTSTQQLSYGFIQTDLINFALQHAGLDFYRMDFTNTGAHAITDIKFDIKEPKLGKIVTDLDKDLKKKMLQPHDKIELGFLAVTAYGNCSARLNYEVTGEERIIELSTDNPNIEFDHSSASFKKVFSTASAMQIISGFSTIEAGLMNIVQDEIKDRAKVKAKDLITEWDYNIVVLHNSTATPSISITVKIKEQLGSKIVNLTTDGKVKRFEKYTEIYFDSIEATSKPSISFVGVSPKVIDFNIIVNDEFKLKPNLPKKIENLDIIWNHRIGKKLVMDLAKLGTAIKTDSD